MGSHASKPVLGDEVVQLRKRRWSMSAVKSLATASRSSGAAKYVEESTPGVATPTDIPSSPEPTSSSTGSDASSHTTVSSRDETAAAKSLESDVIDLPNLFASFMSGEALVNPSYLRVKPEADAWAARVCKFDCRMARRNARADFTFLSAQWVPWADAAGLRLMTDWNQWVFAFDGQFDEGHLKEDPILACEEIMETLAILDDTHPPVSAEENPIRHMFQTVWSDFKQKSSKDQQVRYKRMHRKYMIGCLKQVHWQSDKKRCHDVEHYLEYRRASVGTYPVLPVVECAHGIDLPWEVMEHPCILACEEVVTDIVILENDVLSMRKDLEYGVEHNMITRLRSLGFSMQGAMDRVGGMLDECYERWDDAVRRMPVWGEPIDAQVRRLLEGYRAVALGTLHWSFQTGRYLGDDGPEVRKTRTLQIGRDLVN